MPKISIITPTFNCGRFIRRCIDSVLAQGWSDFEHIIVDGASSDDTVSILGSYPHLTWVSEPDDGEAFALNKALARASGDIICWLNADDWLEPGAFAAVSAIFKQHPDAGIVYGNCHMVAEDEKLLWEKKTHFSVDLGYLVRWWFHDTHPHQPAMFYANWVFRVAGPFDTSLHFSIDYEHWLRAAGRCRFVHLAQNLASARQRDNCKSDGTIAEQIKSHWRVLIPHLSFLSEAERVAFWSEYYRVRQHNPNPFEETYGPNDDSATIALAALVTDASDARKSSSSERMLLDIFKSAEPIVHFVDRLEELLARRGDNAILPYLQGFLAGEPVVANSKHQSILVSPGTLAEFPVSAVREQDSNRLQVAPLTLSPTSTNRVILASDIAASTSADLTQVARDSQFQRAIREVFATYRPQRIIETGTYLGTGTTAIIAQAIADYQIANARFISIEINPSHYAQACANLQRQGFSSVEVLHGLSVPKSMLPSRAEIERLTVKDIEFDGVIIDHQEQERAAKYFQETDFQAPEDMLGLALERFDFQPDFVLLDSAGYMGNVEYNYLLSKLKAPCIIALDDVNHIKHRRSYLQIRSDPRFELVRVADEKFGFAIAKFIPDPRLADSIVDTQVKRVLWHRLDSIGDAVLSMSMLPWIKARYPNAEITVVCQQHLEELYQACPLVADTIGVDKTRVAADQEYRDVIIGRIVEVAADVLLNSTYSREPISEVLAISSRAKRIVGMEGDLSNISNQIRNETNKIYSDLIKTGELGAAQLELDKHRTFLQGLGIKSVQLQPRIWTKPEDEQFAESFFKREELDPSRTVALFAGAQHLYRSCAELGAASAPIAQREKLTVLAFGIAAEYDLNESNCRALGVQYRNLSGSLSLCQTTALLRRCRIAVGTETSLAHMACAVGIPNVIVIGGGHFGRFMPYSELTSLVCLPLECFNCNWQCRYREHHCLRDIKPKVIEQAISETLSRPSSRIRVFCQRSGEYANELLTANQALASTAFRPKATSLRALYPGTNFEIIEIPSQTEAAVAFGSFAFCPPALSPLHILLE